ncbi:MAG TPA: RES family NAD+ phosphorylase [Thermomicrobiales bacterium]
MTPPEDWDPRSAVATCDVVQIKQAIWRGHRRRYDPLHHGGSLRVSGRFHRAPSEFSSEPTWPALYTGLDLAVVLGELQRNIRQEEFGDYRFTEIWAQLESVLDCRDLGALGLTFENLLGTRDYTLGQDLAAAAIDLGVEGMLVPSATRLGDNLIVFPHLVRTGSVLVAVRSIDPRLVK